MLITKIDVEKNTLSVNKNIDEIIRHLKLIKDDLNDENHSEQSMSSSIAIRYAGYTVLTVLLETQLKQIL